MRRLLSLILFAFLVPSLGHASLRHRCRDIVKNLGPVANYTTQTSIDLKKVDSAVGGGLGYFVTARDSVVRIFDEHALEGDRHGRIEFYPRPAAFQDGVWVYGSHEPLSLRETALRLREDGQRVEGVRRFFKLVEIPHGVDREEAKGSAWEFLNSRSRASRAFFEENKFVRPHLNFVYKKVSKSNPGGYLFVLSEHMKLERPGYVALEGGKLALVLNDPILHPKDILAIVPLGEKEEEWFHKKIR